MGKNKREPRADNAALRQQVNDLQTAVAQGPTSQMQADITGLRQQVADGEETLQLALQGNDRSNETIEVCHTFVEDCDRATKRADKEARDWERYCFTVFDDTSAQILSQEDAEALGLEDASPELKGETAILKNMADNLSTQRTDNIKFEIHVDCTELATPPSKRATKKSANEYIVNLTCYDSSTDAFCTKPVTTSPVDLHTVGTINSLKSTCNIDAALKLGGIANRDIRYVVRVEQYDFPGESKDISTTFPVWIKNNKADHVYTRSCWVLAYDKEDEEKATAASVRFMPPASNVD